LDRHFFVRAIGENTGDGIAVGQGHDVLLGRFGWKRCVAGSPQRGQLGEGNKNLPQGIALPEELFILHFDGFAGESIAIAEG
jgi:hypothetical protein